MAERSVYEDIVEHHDLSTDQLTLDLVAQILEAPMIYWWLFTPAGSRCGAAYSNASM